MRSNRIDGKREGVVSSPRGGRTQTLGKLTLSVSREAKMEDLFQKIVLCPNCKAGRLLPPSNINGEVRCSACATQYPVKEGVLDLLPASPHKQTLAQWTMEFEPIVRIYESRLWRRSPIVTALMGISFEQEYETITRAAKLDGSEILLDLACGPGIYARPLAHQLTHGMVVGLDLSMPMLTYASRRARMEGRDNLLLIHGDATDLPLSESRFDVVNCCGALHLFSDLHRVLGHVTRVLKPGGRFTIAAFRKRASMLAERAVRLRQSVIGMNAFRPDELESQFTQAGLGDVECHHAKGVWLIMSATKQS